MTLTVIFLLTLSSAAFASQSRDFVLSGNSQVGSISNGHQGYSWNHSGSDREGTVYIKKALDRYTQKWNNKINWCRNLNYNSDSERYFYVDANGVKHYFRLDSNRDYAVNQYEDENGITQFAFEDKGWK